MQQYIFAATCVAVIVLLVVFVVRGNKKRKVAQSELGALIDIAALPGTPVVAATGQYVATVFADRPLEKIVTGGLGFRGKAQLIVTEQAMGIERLGEESFVINKDALLEVSRESATIDRAVETGGLLSITWNLGGTAVATQLRLDRDADTAELAAALQSLKKEGAR
ncbi:MAG: hypothetical protein RLZZ164_770 [Actinomycetota bacterium]